MEEFVLILLCFEKAAHISSAQTGFGSSACLHSKTAFYPSTEVKYNIFMFDYLPQILEAIDFY